MRGSAVEKDPPAAGVTVTEPCVTLTERSSAPRGWSMSAGVSARGGRQLVPSSFPLRSVTTATWLA